MEDNDDDIVHDLPLCDFVGLSSRSRTYQGQRNYLKSNRELHQSNRPLQHVSSNNNNENNRKQDSLTSSSRTSSATTTGLQELSFSRRGGNKNYSKPFRRVSSESTMKTASTVTATVSVTACPSSSSSTASITTSGSSSESTSESPTSSSPSMSTSSPSASPSPSSHVTLSNPPSVVDVSADSVVDDDEEEVQLVDNDMSDGLEDEKCNRPEGSEESGLSSKISQNTARLTLKSKQSQPKNMRINGSVFKLPSISSLEGQSWSSYMSKISPRSSSLDTCSSAYPATLSASSKDYNRRISIKSKDLDSENMKLKREDIAIYGLHPARDACIVTTCDECGQVLKYQALSKHKELRHSNMSNTILTSGIETPPSSARSDNSSSSTSSSVSNSNILDIGGNDGTSGVELSITRLTPSMSPPARVSDELIGNKDPGLCVKISSMSITSSSLGNHHSNSTSNNNQSHQIHSISVSRLPAVVSSSKSAESLNHSLPSPSQPSSPVVKISSCSSPLTLGKTEGISLLKSVSSPSSSTIITTNNSQSPPTVKLKISGLNTHNLAATTTLSTSSSQSSCESYNIGNVSSPISTPKVKSKSIGLPKEKFLPCKDRQYDPDKHCGVKLEAMDKECTRSLTCKTHSLSLRRHVPGRSKSFDDLLEEHRKAKEEALILAGKEVKITKRMIKQRELEAKKAAATPGKPSTPSPCQSPSPSISSLSSPAINNFVTPPSLAAGCNMSSIKQSMAAKINKKKDKKTKDEADQPKNVKPPGFMQLDGRSSEATSTSVIVKTLPPLQSMSCLSNLISRPKSEVLMEDEDSGVAYLKHPPRPLAINKFNSRHLNLSYDLSQGMNGSHLIPFNGQDGHSFLDPCAISSRIYSRASDSTYAALRTLFQVPSNSNINSSTSNSVNFSINASKTPNVSPPKPKKKKASAGKNAQNQPAFKLESTNTMSVSVTTINPSPSTPQVLPVLQPSNGHAAKRKQSLKVVLPNSVSSTNQATSPSLTSLLESPTTTTIQINSNGQIYLQPNGPMKKMRSNLMTPNSSATINSLPVHVTGTNSFITSPMTSISTSKTLPTTSYSLSLNPPCLESLLDSGLPSVPPAISLNLDGLGSVGGSVGPIVSSRPSLLASTLESGSTLAANNCGHQANDSMTTLMVTTTSASLKPKNCSSTSPAQHSPRLISLLDSPSTPLVPVSLSQIHPSLIQRSQPKVVGGGVNSS